MAIGHDFAMAVQPGGCEGVKGVVRERLVPQKLRNIILKKDNLNCF